MLDLRLENVTLYNSAESRGLFTSFICALTANSNYAFLQIHSTIPSFPNPLTLITSLPALPLSNK
jgi:hypothetical protein